MNQQHARSANLAVLALGLVGLSLVGPGVWGGVAQAGEVGAEQVEKAVQLFQRIRTTPALQEAYCEMVRQQRRYALADQHDKPKIEEAKKLAAAHAAKLEPGYADTLRLVTSEDLPLDQARRIGQAKQALSESCPKS